MVTEICLYLDRYRRSKMSDFGLAAHSPGVEFKPVTCPLFLSCWIMCHGKPVGSELMSTCLHMGETVGALLRPLTHSPLQGFAVCLFGSLWHIKPHGVFEVLNEQVIDGLISYEQKY